MAAAHPTPIATTSSSARAPAAARSPRGWPKPAGTWCCWRPAAIRDAERQRIGGSLPDDYDVPAFHPFASENEAMRWDFFVRHYADDAAGRRRDPQMQADRGVLYPRAGTLGGCTAHNAMIFVLSARQPTGTASPT